MPEAPRPGAVDLAAACAALACSLALWGPTPAALAAAAYLLMLWWVARQDLARRVVPNRLVLCVAALGLLVAACGVPFPDAGTGLGARLAGALAAGAPLALARAAGGAVGGGDVKLLAASGLVLGLRAGLVALATGLVLGAACAVALLLRGARGSDSFALAPSLAAGCAVAAALASPGAIVVLTTVTA